MSNMSYCRFQNTVIDLNDCHDALQEMDGEDEDGLSADEARAKKRLLHLCKIIARDYGDEDD